MTSKTQENKHTTGERIMIEFKNVNVEFKQKRKTVWAVKDVSFKIKKGDIFGIVGSSGAGKSTIVRTINSLQTVTSGEVIVDGQNIVNIKEKDLRKLRQNIGMIFQNFNLIKSNTVYENVAFALKAAGKSKKEIDLRVKELLEFVNLSDKIYDFPKTLSGGQKQRVAIARALANNAKILLCDEPTSALDLETTAAVLELLRDVNEKLGVTIVIITHELDVVKEVCNMVAVMDSGELVEIGDVYEVFAKPQNEFTTQLINHSQKFILPESLLKNIKGPILKLTYLNENADKPLLSLATEKYGVQFNILHGIIEYIEKKPVGILYVNVIGSEEVIPEVLNYISSKVEKLEVVHNA